MIVALLGRYIPIRILRNTPAVRNWKGLILHTPVGYMTCHILSLTNLMLVQMVVAPFEITLLLYFFSSQPCWLNDLSYPEPYNASPHVSCSTTGSSYDNTLVLHVLPSQDCWLHEMLWPMTYITSPHVSCSTTGSSYDNTLVLHVFSS